MSSVPPTTWTILTVLQWAHKYLQSKGISEPRPSAEVLLAHCLNCNRLELYLRHDQPLADGELSCYKSLLKRRLAHEPTQYITGHQEFWSLDFLVSPAVLIPRPETELLVEAVLKHLTPDRTSGERRGGSWMWAPAAAFWRWCWPKNSRRPRSWPWTGPGRP